LSASGRAHATQIGKNLAEIAEKKLFKFDAVVSSPYRRCMETAVRVCTELQVPLAIDERIGEIQNDTMMGERLSDFGTFHRSALDNIEFAKANGVEVIGIEEICGITPTDDIPAWPESVQKGFKRYTKAFELFVSSGKSILCVTHGMGLVSVANTYCDEFQLFQCANPNMGDFFVCNTSSPRRGSKSRRSKYRVITHSRETRAEQAAMINFKRSVSCTSEESLAERRSGSCSSVSYLVPIDESRCPDLSPKYHQRRGKLPPLSLPIKSKTAYV
jgi:broad specificity phosphatase PhoE